MCLQPGRRGLMSSANVALGPNKHVRRPWSQSDPLALSQLGITACPAKACSFKCSQLELCRTSYAAHSAFLGSAHWHEVYRASPRLRAQQQHASRHGFARMCVNTRTRHLLPALSPRRCCAAACASLFPYATRTQTPPDEHVHAPRLPSARSPSLQCTAARSSLLPYVAWTSTSRCVCSDAVTHSAHLSARSPRWYSTAARSSLSLPRSSGEKASRDVTTV